MSAKILAFYCIGGALLVLGILLGCLSGFGKVEWFMIATGFVTAFVGFAVQMGWIDPPAF